MSYKALVIEDDPAILDAVDDILISLKHEYDWAWNQQEARSCIKGNEYSYILLDLEIPVKSRGGIPRIQNGVNLLDEIRSTKNCGTIPIIIMTDHAPQNSEQTVEMIRLATALHKRGAVDFINKPFPSIGRTLDRVIKKNVARRPPAHSLKPGVFSAKPRELQPFKGGELVFYPECVELCEMKILGDTGAGQMRKILEALKEIKVNGKFSSYSGMQLAKIIKTRGGQNAVAGCIRGFRDTVIKTLEEDAGLICGRQDVIQSGGRGYRLNEWITVRENESAVTGALVCGHGIISGTVKGRNGIVSDPNEPVDNRVEKRRGWILAELKKGRKFRSPAVAKGLECSQRTAARDLEALKLQGMIEFIGAPRTGYYRLKG